MVDSEQCNKRNKANISSCSSDSLLRLTRLEKILCWVDALPVRSQRALDSLARSGAHWIWSNTERTAAKADCARATQPLLHCKTDLQVTELSRPITASTAQRRHAREEREEGSQKRRS